jgi:EAL domain-containing protein (putative c-di-GMP-specific phosphodiesterase class I)
MQSKARDAGEVPLHELLAEVLAGDPTGGGFEVPYQPVVRFAGGATMAVEAVACWQHLRVMR